MPIEAIFTKIGTLRTGGRSVIVCPHVAVERVNELHKHLNSNDSNYTKDVHLPEHLGRVLKINAVMKKHVLETPYSFSIRKCNNESCCGKV